MDLVESFVTIRAGVSDVWPFITELDRIAMWSGPFEDLVTQEPDVRRLEPGTLFYQVGRLPGRPTLTVQVLSPEEGAEEGQGRTLCIQFSGPLEGTGLWRVVPAGRNVIVQHRIAYDLADRRWLIPWVLLGRWLLILQLHLKMRRLRGRVEDTVGSSTFGVPLLVSRYALATGAAMFAFLVAVLALLTRRRQRSDD